MEIHEMRQAKIHGERELRLYEIYDRVRAQLTEKEITDLSLAIMVINAWNRLSGGVKTVPGSADANYRLDKAGLRYVSAKPRRDLQRRLNASPRYSVWRSASLVSCAWQEAMPTFADPSRRTGHEWPEEVLCASQADQLATRAVTHLRWGLC